MFSLFTIEDNPNAFVRRGFEGSSPEDAENAVRPIVRRRVQLPEHLRRCDSLNLLHEKKNANFTCGIHELLANN